MLEIIWANPRAFVVVVVVCLFVFKGMKDFVFLVTQYLISFFKPNSHCPLVGQNSKMTQKLLPLYTFYV